MNMQAFRRCVKRQKFIMNEKVESLLSEKVDSFMITHVSELVKSG